MASPHKKTVQFQAEDFSRFLIREFLKKSGFDRTYDIFMTEDRRPKVTMTKSELTNLLGLESLVRNNSRTKAFNTMLDVISDYLVLMKTSAGGVALPSSQPNSGSKSVNRAGLSSNETTSASSSSFPHAQPAPAGRLGQNRTSGPVVGSYGTQQPTQG